MELGKANLVASRGTIRPPFIPRFRAEQADLAPT